MPRARRLPIEVGVPRHQALAEDLVRRIRDGEFVVGDRLPTEQQLTADYGVSRGTVRQALERLDQLGMIARQKRVGTTLIATGPSDSYQPAAQTTDDIRALVSATRLVSPAMYETKADAVLAKKLGVKRGSRWFVVEGVRVTRGAGKSPLCWSEHYLRSDYPREVLELGVYPTKLATDHRIEQTISSAGLSSEIASALGTETGKPALVVTRRVFTPDGDLINLGIHTHRADRYEVTTLIQDGERPPRR